MPHSLSAALAEHHCSLCGLVPDWAKLPAKEKLGLLRTARADWCERAMYGAWKEQSKAAISAVNAKAAQLALRKVAC